MFSGIIEEMGRLLSREGGGSSHRFVIGANRIIEDLSPGDSISVDGVCLTVERIGKGDFTVYSSPETLSRTTLLDKQPGRALNLERALAPSGRVNGHFVLGHVDGVGKAIKIEQEADSWRFAFRIPGELEAFCVEKGSIAIDGISLTIAGIRENTIESAIIPFTYNRTTLQYLKTGEPVNLETDIFAKYTRKFLEPYKSQKGITEEWLYKAGFIE